MEAAPTARRAGWLPPSPLRDAHFSGPSKASLEEKYKNALPYRHLQVDGLCRPDAMAKVREECLELPRTYRETDLFKIYQTIDLSNVSLDSDLARSMPTLMSLRVHLYSEGFRSFLQEVTGCGPLTARVDCSFNVYQRGCHLLCHDDAISTRKVSYIVYLSDDDWKTADGGGLELYPAEAQVEGKRDVPGHTPSKVLPPVFNSIVFFEVIPGRTFHAVQEVFAHTKRRCSIQGWFHAPERAEGLATRASLRLIQSADLTFDHDEELKKLCFEDYAEKDSIRADLSFLRHFVSRTYTLVDVIAQIREEFSGTGDVILSDFLDEELAASITKLVVECDKRDRLGTGQPTPPSYSSGVCGPWEALGPVILNRYVRYDSTKAVEAKGDAKSGKLEKGRAEASDPRLQLGELLETVRAQLFASRGFSRLLEWLTGLPPPSSWSSEIRRFRPGLDYTVGCYRHVAKEGEVVIEVTLCFVDERPVETTEGEDPVENDNGEAAQDSGPSRKRQRKVNRWETDEYGGFEASMSVDSTTEGDDAEAYVEQSGSKSGEEKQGGVNVEGGDGSEDREEDVEEGLTSASAANNMLRITLKKPKQMKFVRFLSSEAPGSRFDISSSFKLDMKMVVDEAGE